MARIKKTRVPDRETYKRRIQDLLDNPPSKQIDDSSAMALDAHWAKYVCVLVSGYLEQSIKEILHHYCANKSEIKVHSYITNSWEKSQNMNSRNIVDLITKFDRKWGKSITDWLGKGDDSNASVINSIVSRRNNIAHGSESLTTGVTVHSVTNQFDTAKSLIAKLEEIVFRT